MAASVWNNGMYVRANELARDGYSDAEIARALGCTPATLSDWKRNDEHFRNAINRGRGDGGDKGRLADYVYNRLPSRLQELWDRIDECEKVRNGTRKIELLLAEAGKTARQHLFLYALVRSAFNTSDACSKVLITLKELEDWKNNDPEFAELVDEIHEHKRNWCEGAVFRGVANDVPQLVMYANTALNADKGYGAKTVNVNKKVDATHKHEHVHAVITTEQVMGALDLQGKIKLMNALKQVKVQRQEDEQRGTTPPQPGQYRPPLGGPVDPGERLPYSHEEGRRGTAVGAEWQGGQAERDSEADRLPGRQPEVHRGGDTQEEKGEEK